jgi:hypothetical protein
MKRLRLRRSRRIRTRVAWVSLALLLFQQVVLAAYVCPASEPPAEVPPMPADCAHMEAPDPAAPTLCHEHCQPDHLATPDLKLLQVPALTLHRVHIALADPSAPAVESALYEDIPICQSDPPPALRFCSLLI